MSREIKQAIEQAVAALDRALANIEQRDAEEKKRTDARNMRRGIVAALHGVIPLIRR